MIGDDRFCYSYGILLNKKKKEFFQIYCFLKYSNKERHLALKMKSRLKETVSLIFIDN